MFDSRVGQCTQGTLRRARWTVRTSLGVGNAYPVVGRPLMLALFGIFASLVLIPSRSVVADEYVITPVETGLESVAGSDEAPVILADGSVLYMLESRLMRFDGEARSVVFKLGENPDITSYSVRDVDFNSRGDFVAMCRTKLRQVSLVLFRDGKTTVLDRRASSDLGLPSLNENGYVAYTIRTADRTGRIMLHDGKESTAVGLCRSLHPVALNSDLKIAVSGWQGVSMVDAKTEPPQVDDVPSVQELSDIDGMKLNERGDLVFRANRPRSSICIVKQGKLEQLIHSTGDIASVGLPSLNDRGQVACLIVMNNGTESVIVHDGKDAIPVVSSGDELGGSTITSLRLSNYALNEQGSLTFWALLLDGTEGIYRAVPANAEVK